ncbi:NUDIX hydrolase [Microbacterium sp. SSW1-59]|uniref:NUDIX hydrolase n=1 Tax=Microbacterium xanthum TaxID=3079794 RepID=UPI002AD517B8|nr:NUDIX hydrolase [Microbacterium sp. SSW1-59]MDZ8199985.1 NUDIX hydrolase [Microbacterium sp. SSW1-59]
MTARTVYAAGGVVWRVVDGKLRILLVHRTKYRDLSLPKGKVDPGETLPETAAREIHEETGIRVSLGVHVGISHYRLPRDREKIVHYWAAEATDAAVRASSFVPNKEIAGLEWVSPKKALKRLSYPVDVDIVEKFRARLDEGALRTFPLVMLRHGKAVSRDDFDGCVDSERPLAPRGRRQAQELVGPLLAFGVRKIVSSPAVRCTTTVRPLAAALGSKVHLEPGVSQDAWEEGCSDVRRVVGDRVRARRPAVLCSHGPVLPDIAAELALATGSIPGSYLGSVSSLDTGDFTVVHLSADNPGSGIVATEKHSSGA